MERIEKLLEKRIMKRVSVIKHDEIGIDSDAKGNYFVYLLVC
jgi:hypothetical protein